MRPVKKQREFAIPRSTRKAYGLHARNLYRLAAATLKEAESLDTAVRDYVADGVARIVMAAADCNAISANLGFEDSERLIQASVFDWFQQRGFTTWYCRAASTLFQASEPRLRDMGQASTSGL